MNDNVLTIAGFDPTGGAGILADIKTIHMFGLYGFAVVTANTIQTERTFVKPCWIRQDEIKEQLNVLLRAHTFDVVKIGIVESLDLLEEIIGILRSHNSQCRIIWDPVLKSSTGFSFHTNLENDRLNEILKSVYLVTPNFHEAEILGLLEGNPYCNVLVKGGHRNDGSSDDILYLKNEGRQAFRSAYLNGAAKHGSGCVLSSAIASSLKQGFLLAGSCERAKNYVREFLLSEEGLLGKHEFIEG